MKILEININCGVGSTGRICVDLAKELEKQGHEVKIAYGRDEVPKQYKKYAIRIGCKHDVYTHVVCTRILDCAGLRSKKATRRFVRWMEEYDPDIIHLHNLHGYYINIEILFEYIRRAKKKVIWTLHDCWNFTGHCTHFDYINCEKWKTGCEQCEQKMEYPASYLIDKSKSNYLKKRQIFSNIENVTIVTPSEWLAKLVKKSFLKEYPIVVINNGIDTDIFKPVNVKNIREKLRVEDKKIVLGVASKWYEKKGINVFIELSKILDESYQIVLVGVSKKIQKKLPSSIIGIQRTDNINELAELYSAAYVYVNPTLEDNYPTTNLEAIACGTPVISFNTGGSGESACVYGCVTLTKDVRALALAIEESLFVRKEKDIDYRNVVKRYIELYMSSSEKEKL